MIKYILFSLIGGFLILTSNDFNTILSEETTVISIEEKLGADYSDKRPNFDLPNVSVEAGKAILKDGFSINKKGKKSRKQSKHFVCTSCHNLQKEDPDLSVSDPEARLKYVIDKGLPFLQGTTLYGAVNRKTFYNGDYDKKYGDLVVPARNDIRGAIQLCAVECAQGRKLKDWEIESVLAYLWTLELKVADLNLTSEEKQNIKTASSENEELLKVVQSKYLSGSPATFIPPPADRKKGSGLVGNPINGEKIYNASCLHCHKDGRYSYLSLDQGKMSLNHLEWHITRYTNKSLYQVTRWGVPSLAGRKSYMPQYPLEKMNEQQLSDLRAYIEQ